MYSKYIFAAAAYSRANQISILMYDLRFLGSSSYDGDNLQYEPSRITIDYEAAISMARWNKGTAGNRHVIRRFNYVRQGTSLNEHGFEWIRTKHQQVDTKSLEIFQNIWSKYVFTSKSKMHTCIHTYIHMYQHLNNKNTIGITSFCSYIHT